MSEPSSSMLAMELASTPEIVGAYALLSVVGLVVAKAVQLAVLGWLEPSAPPTDEATTSARPKRLRAKAVTEDLDLAELGAGKLPSADLVAHVAYLRGAEAAVAELLVARAEAEGWLARLDEGALRVGEPDRWASSLTRELRGELKVTELGRSSVLSAAHTVARRHAEGFEADLVEAGLLRSAGARGAGRMASVAVGLATAGAVLVRAADEAGAGRPHMPLVALFFVALAGTGLVASTTRLTRQGEAYLRWLLDSTEALRADVARGAVTAPDDVALAAALAPAEPDAANAG